MHYKEKNSLLSCLRSLLFFLPRSVKIFFMLYNEPCPFVWQHAENGKNAAAPTSWREDEKAAHTYNTKASLTHIQHRPQWFKQETCPMVCPTGAQLCNCLGRFQRHGFAEGRVSLETGFEVSQSLVIPGACSLLHVNA